MSAAAEETLVIVAERARAATLRAILVFADPAQRQDETPDRRAFDRWLEAGCPTPYEPEPPAALARRVIFDANSMLHLVWTVADLSIRPAPPRQKRRLSFDPL